MRIVRLRISHCAAAAPGQSSRELDGPLRGCGQYCAGSLLRAGADRGCSSRLCRRVWAPDVCQAPGPRYLGARARHRPRRGVGCQFVSSVAPSLCPTFFSVASGPREPHYIAPPRELSSCELCAVCPAHQQSGPGATAGDSVPVVVKSYFLLTEYFRTSRSAASSTPAWYRRGLQALGGSSACRHAADGRMYALLRQRAARF